MRFPIVVKRGFGEHIEYSNLSAGLQESLRDLGVLDPKTNQPRQNYFDLEIAETPLVVCLNEFFDLTPQFHIGCSLDERPPSFSFLASSGSYETREGKFHLSYTRHLKWDVFACGDFLRNDQGHRDLHATASAFNDRKNYVEGISVGWHGWSGEMIGDRKSGFYGDRVYLEMDAQRPERSKLVYQEKLEPKLRALIEGNLPQGQDYPVSDAIFSLMKMASRVFATKLDVDSNRQKIEKACEGL